MGDYWMLWSTRDLIICIFVNEQNQMIVFGENYQQIFGKQSGGITIWICTLLS